MTRIGARARLAAGHLWSGDFQNVEGRAQRSVFVVDVKSIGDRAITPQWLWDTYVIVAPLEMLIDFLDLRDLRPPNRLAVLVAV